MPKKSKSETTLTAQKLDYIWRLNNPDDATGITSGTVVKSRDPVELGKHVRIIILLTFNGFDDLIRGLKKIHKANPNLEPYVHTVSNREPYLVVVQTTTDGIIENLKFGGIGIHLCFYVAHFPSVNFFEYPEVAKILRGLFWCYEEGQIVLWEDVLAVRVKLPTKPVYWVRYDSFVPSPLHP